MPINVPTENLPSGDLARCKTQEADQSWPSLIEVVAYFGSKDAPRKGKRKSIEIPADRFFGRGGHGAPMTGDQIITMIDRLRRNP